MRRGWTIRGRTLSLDHTLIMGVLNVTPDSFSDGGRFSSVDEAVAEATKLVSEGADLVDVGGESTRPGAEPVSVADELRRVLPVVGRLVESGVVVSIDTAKAEVASACLGAGAHVVNDVTALSDPDMMGVVSEHQAGLVLMHMQGTPRTMQANPQYEDVVGEVRDYLLAAAASAEAAGAAPSSIAIDPGIGFGKGMDHNLQLLAATDLLAATGYPVVIGVSRKTFLGTLIDEPDPLGRDLATAAVTAFTIGRGAAIARVHNVRQIREVCRVVDAIVSSEWKSDT